MTEPPGWWQRAQTSRTRSQGKSLRSTPSSRSGWVSFTSGIHRAHPVCTQPDRSRCRVPALLPGGLQFPKLVTCANTSITVFLSSRSHPDWKAPIPCFTSGIHRAHLVCTQPDRSPCRIPALLPGGLQFPKLVTCANTSFTVSSEGWNGKALGRPTRSMRSRWLHARKRSLSKAATLSRCSVFSWFAP